MIKLEAFIWPTVSTNYTVICFMIRLAYNRQYWAILFHKKATSAK